MASLLSNMVPLGLIESIFKLECPMDRVSFFRQFESCRDIYRVDLSRMFNNQSKKLECPKMAITSSTTYTSNVWNGWCTESPTSATTTPSSTTISETWTTWTRDRYVYYYDVDTYSRGEQRVEAIWSVWSDEKVRITYENVADEITEGLANVSERMGRAFERAAFGADEAANAMRRVNREYPNFREQEKRSRLRYQKLKAQKEEAEAKAKDLLLDIIGKNELAVYEETGRVFVKGKKHDYIVQKEGFVQQINKGKIQDLCAHINKAKYPLTDNVVAMKMLIESDEEQFLKIANKHGSRQCDKLPKSACM